MKLHPLMSSLWSDDSGALEAIEFLLERMKRTKTNVEFFATMAQG